MEIVNQVIISLDFQHENVNFFINKELLKIDYIVIQANCKACSLLLPLRD